MVIGGSDAGAHLDTIWTFNCISSLVGPSVRDRQLIALEEAVRLVTDVPARMYGLIDRGRLAVGWHADIVVFDPATLNPEPVRAVSDLPCRGLALDWWRPRGGARVRQRCRDRVRRRVHRGTTWHGVAVRTFDPHRADTG